MDLARVQPALAGLGFPSWLRVRDLCPRSQALGFSWLCPFGKQISYVTLTNGLSSIEGVSKGGKNLHRKAIYYKVVFPFSVYSRPYSKQQLLRLTLLSWNSVEHIREFNCQFAFNIKTPSK